MILPKSKYKGVSANITQGKYFWWIATLTHKNINYKKHFKSEREAAIAYDKMRIEIGKKPINILKPKKRT